MAVCTETGFDDVAVSVLAEDTSMKFRVWFDEQPGPVSRSLEEKTVGEVFAVARSSFDEEAVCASREQLVDNFRLTALRVIFLRGRLGVVQPQLVSAAGRRRSRANVRKQSANR
jgi:hypothetical protein